MSDTGTSNRGDSLAALSSAFGDQIAVLQQAASLRCADLSRHAADLAELEASVQALDDSLQQIQAVVAHERAQFPQAKALAEALQQQASHLTSISENLPAFLPAAPQPSSSEEFDRASSAAASGEPDKENAQPAQARNAAAAAPQAKKARPGAPRRYITVQELDKVSSYLRGRLTQDKVNAAVDDVAALAEANAKLVAAARGRGHGLSVDDRRHAQTLIRNVASQEGVKGHFWLLERDCRNGTALKMDKTGKAILTILRQLGRLGELHCQMDEGKFENVYVLQSG